MKALTIQQPWIWAIQHAGKRVENRSWLPPFDLMRGDYFAIHAGKELDVSACHDLQEAGFGLPDRRSIPLSAICGIARIKPPIWRGGRDPGSSAPVAVVVTSHGGKRVGEPIELGDQGKWFFGPFGWPLTDFFWLREPIPCRGKQKIWVVPDTAYQQMRAEWARQHAVAKSTQRRETG